MSRFLALALLVLFAGSSTGLTTLLSDACDEACADDRGGAECPPSCGTCVCAARIVSADAPVPAAAPVMVAASADVTVAPERDPADPDPTEIFHPPRRAGSFA